MVAFLDLMTLFNIYKSKDGMRGMESVEYIVDDGRNSMKNLVADGVVQAEPAGQAQRF